MPTMGLRGVTRGRRVRTTVPADLAERPLDLVERDFTADRPKLEWVWWFNERRLLEPLGYLPPAEYEDAFYRRLEAQASELALT